MAKWYEDAIAEKIREAGNHVILVPAQNENAPIDTVDVFDGKTGTFIVSEIPEEPAREFAVIWNGLVDSGESTETIRTFNLEWLSGVKANRKYGA